NHPAGPVDDGAALRSRELRLCRLDRGELGRICGGGLRRRSGDRELRGAAQDDHPPTAGGAIETRSLERQQRLRGRDGVVARSDDEDENQGEKRWSHRLDRRLEVE